MALIFAPRVLETSTTTGTGTLTLAGAVTGYQAFSAVCANADTAHYYIEAVDASGVPTGDWETGLGTWATGGTLARTTVYASSNAGSAVSLAAGTKRVALSLVAQWFKGATLTPAVGSSALTVVGATQTTNQPVFDAAQTWNASGVTFTGWKLNITNTASAALSLLSDWQVGGASVVGIKKDGRLVATDIGTSNDIEFYNTLPNALALTAAQRRIAIGSNPAGIRMAGNYQLGWSSNNAGSSDCYSIDTYLTRGGAAATVQLGALDAASPVAQTLRSQGSRSGTDSNVGGANLTLQSGTGTGTGTLSVLNLASPIPAASGTGAQTMATGLQIKGGAAVLTSYVVASLPTGLPAGATAFVTDASTTIILGLGATVVGGGANKVPVYFDGTNWIIG